MAWLLAKGRCRTCGYSRLYLFTDEDDAENMLCSNCGHFSAAAVRYYANLKELQAESRSPIPGPLREHQSYAQAKRN